MTRGEELRINIHYDLFGFDVYKKRGIYVSTSEASGKILIYFPKLGDWGEFLIDQVKRVEPGVVTQKNAEFIECVKKMEYSTPAGPTTKAKL